MIKLMNKYNLTLSMPKNTLVSLQKVLFFSLLTLSTTLSAGIYKWVDEAGNVHYGSQRPADNKAERLKIQVNKPDHDQKTTTDNQGDANKSAETDTAEKDKEEEATADTEKKPEKPKLSRAEKNRLCSQARKRVSTIESRGRLKTTDKQGSQRFLTDKERMARLKDARKDVKKYCQ